MVMTWLRWDDLRFCQSLPKAHFTSMYDCVSGGVQCIYKLAYEIGSYNALNMLIRHFR